MIKKIEAHEIKCVRLHGMKWKKDDKKKMQPNDRRITTLMNVTNRL